MKFAKRQHYCNELCGQRFTMNSFWKLSYIMHQMVGIWYQSTAYLNFTAIAKCKIWPSSDAKVYDAWYKDFKRFSMYVSVGMSKIFNPPKTKLSPWSAWIGQWLYIYIVNKGCELYQVDWEPYGPETFIVYDHAILLYWLAWLNTSGVGWLNRWAINE